MDTATTALEKVEEVEVVRPAYFLSNEETKDTRTVYFPLDRSAGISPDFTVVMSESQEAGEGKYNVGVAFCSPSDHFVKARGRRLAFGRMGSKSAICGTPEEIRKKILSIRLKCEVKRSGPDLSKLFVVLARDIGTIMNSKKLKELFSPKKKATA